MHVTDYYKGEVFFTDNISLK